MMKKQMAAVAAGMMAVLSLAACGGSSAKATTAAAEKAAETTAAASEQAESSAASAGKTFKVGIIQMLDHPSLNQIEENIEKELDKKSEETGITFDYKDNVKNGQGDASTLNQIATDMVEKKVDVIIPIATLSAQAAQTAAEGTDIPIVFSAISDPVGAKLVDSMDAPGANITGTSDELNTNAIFDLILAVNPDAKKIGLLYSKSEANSTKAIEDAKAYLDSKGIEYVEKTGTNSDELSTAVDALIAEKVDAVFTPTDNTVQAAELALAEKLSDAGIPHYAGADSFALNGAFCGYGVDYAQLGAATADMAVDILTNGSDPAATKVMTFDNGIATVNTETCEKLGLDLDDVKKAMQPYCTSVEEIQTQKEFQQ